MRISTCLLLASALCFASCDRTRRKGGKAAESAGAVAVGKLVITPPALETAKGSAMDAGEAFMEQQLALLRSDEVRRQAEAALQRDSPELTPADAVIIVARMPGSNVVSVSGRGESPPYCSALVDAIMEGYVASVRPKEPERAAAAVAGSGAAERELKEAERDWNTFKLEHDVTRLDANLSAAERRLKRLGVARSYYEQELGMSEKLNLEQDIRRRQASPMLPQDMPAEFAAMAHHTLTVGELAYLSALKQTNAAATEAALKEARKDHDERVSSNRKQLDIVNDTAATTAAEIEKYQSDRKEAARMEARLKTAESRYREMKTQEKNIGAGPNSAVYPVVSIMERAGLVRDSGGR